MIQDDCMNFFNITFFKTFIVYRVVKITATHRLRPLIIFSIIYLSGVEGNVERSE